MHLRFLGISTLSVLAVVSTVVVLSAADAPKGKSKEAKDTKAAKPAKTQAQAQTQAQEDPGIIKFSTAPAAVQKTFKEEAKGANIELLGTAANDQGAFYKATLIFGAASYEVAVADSGLLLEKILQVTTTEVSLDDCPAPVKKTLGEEAKGAKVEGVEKLSEGKRDHYVFDVASSKNAYQIVIMDDGTLISKVVDLSGSDPVPAPAEAKAKSKETGTRKN